MHGLTFINGVPVLDAPTIVNGVTISSGALALSSGGKIFDDGTYLNVLPATGDVTRFGDAGTPDKIAAVNDNVFVSGDTEIDGTLYIGTAGVFGSASSVSGQYVLTSSGWLTIKKSTDDGVLLALGSAAANRHLIITDSANSTKDHDNDTLSANPTLLGYSARDPDESNTEKWSKTHDGDDAIYGVGKGGHKFTTDAQKARGAMSVLGIPIANETFVINATTITFKADGSGDVDHCTIAGNAADQVTNIVATLAECSEAANLTAWDGAGDTVVVEWGTAGVGGNAITWTEAATNIGVDGSGTLGTAHAAVDAATLLDIDEGSASLIKYPLRGATSLWWHHHEISAFNAAPGAAGATFVPPDGTTAGGYQLDANTELLYFGSEVHDDWDEASDVLVDVTFDIRAADPGGGGNTVDLQLLCYIKGAGDAVTKLQTLENAVDIDGGAQWQQYTTTFTIDYDAGGGLQIDPGDLINMILNLETDTSEVDDVTINQVDFFYRTAKVMSEV